MAALGPPKGLLQKYREQSGLSVCSLSSPVDSRLKRAFDVLGAVLLVLISLPVLVIVAAAIGLDSRGPILYSAERAGRYGKPFRLHKFRTMMADAESLRESVMHLNERNSVLFKSAHDPRITRVGKILRKYSLDELPQLFNVISGDMSLVGPRPGLYGEIANYKPREFQRLIATPGITGLWQISYRDNPSFEKYICCDLEYIANWSFVLDLKILLLTIPVVLKGTGA